MEKKENGKFKILTWKHNMQSEPCQPSPNRSDVNIELHEHNTNHWTIGIAESVIVGRDEVTRTAKVLNGKSTL